MKLELVTVLVKQPVKLHTHIAGEPCTDGCGFKGTALYTVDLADGKCHGEITDVGTHFVGIDQGWWTDHCARVGKRVQERLNGMKL